MTKTIIMLIASTIFFANAITVFSQDHAQIAKIKQEIQNTTKSESNKVSRIDSMLSIFYIQRKQMSDTINHIDSNSYKIASEIPDSVFSKRLSKIASIIQLPYNNIVRRCILAYVKKPEKTEEILSLSEYYFPIFEEILNSYGLPMELKIMAVIESALNPMAVSRMGATGPWQFMFKTAKNYGLQINSFVDQRRDPIASCKAAAKYLRDMYNIFGDWSLAIASYNCGAGNVNKAISRSGGKTDFWSIYPYLPRETRSYVPLFIGATYMMKYYKEHGLIKNPAIMPFATDTFKINKLMHFEQISEKTGLPIETLRDLNPQYSRDIIPGIEKTCVLVLPSSFSIKFINKEKDIIEAGDSIYFKKTTAQYATDNTKKCHSYVHVVKKGESISLIAKKYKVKTTDIKKWNNIKNNTIYPKQKLVIYEN